MTDASHFVFVVDDDASVRKALSRIIKAAGFETCAFGSAEDFLERHDPDVPGCLVLDLAMPGLSGLDVQQALASSGCSRPIIFLTGRADVPMSVQALKAGAMDFLIKPVNSDALIDAVRKALENDRQTRIVAAEALAIGRRLASLTPRERQVLGRVVKGRLNKQIAGDLGIVEKTVKVHRARIFEKMGIFSLAELVHVTDRFGLPAETAPRGR